MANGTYYLKAGDQKLGPFTEKQIIGGLRAGKISLFDSIFNNHTGGWVMILQHPDFHDYGISSEPIQDADIEPMDSIQVGSAGSEFTESYEGSALINTSVTEVGEPDYWYENSRPDNRYKFLDIVSLLKQRSFSEYTLIAKTPKGPWKPLIEWEEFSEKGISDFHRNAQVEIPDLSLRRKHPRFDCGKVFIFVFAGKGFKALCPEISKSGMSFIVTAPKCHTGEDLFVRFHENLDGRSFDAKAVVVSIRKVRVVHSANEYLRYSLRFTHLSESGRQIVTDLTGGPSALI